MNSYEIDDAAERLAHHVTSGLRGAALYLQAFRDLIDSISDGWAYWSTGTKCSEALQKIVSEGCHPINQIDGHMVTKAEIDAAKRKIRTFLKRNKQTRELTEVLEFLAKDNN